MAFHVGLFRTLSSAGSAHGLAHYHRGHLIPITWPGAKYTVCPFWKLPGLGAAEGSVKSQAC